RQAPDGRSPAADLEVLPHDSGCRDAPVVRADHRAERTLARCRDQADVVGLTANGVEVARREERDVERVLLQAVHLPGNDDEHVAAQAGNGVADVRARAAAHRLHHDDGGDTDHDPERREHRAHLVSRERRERDGDGGGDHDASWLASERMRPSRKTTCRRAYAAHLLSWVTTSTAMPRSRFSVVKSCRLSLPIFESRFPVGSAARMISGSFTIARAMATRCC